MLDVFVYVTSLPDGINEAVVPCLEGYTVYLNEKLSDDGMVRAYRHALYHIENDDWEKEDVQEIEGGAHEKSERLRHSLSH